MSAVTVIQNNFNGGELSPLMGARTDQVRYGNGCKKLHNMMVLPHGPAASCVVLCEVTNDRSRPSAACRFGCAPDCADV